MTIITTGNHYPSLTCYACNSHRFAVGVLNKHSALVAGRQYAMPVGVPFVRRARRQRAQNLVFFGHHVSVVMDSPLIAARIG